MGPLPDMRPNAGEATAPTPENKPSAGSESGQTQELPATSDAPVPAVRPGSDSEPVADPYHRDTAAARHGPKSSIGRHNWKSLAVSDDASKADQACRERLQKLGVAFETRPALSDPQGCSVPFPLAVSSLGSGVSTEPEAVMNCQMTEAVANFVRSTIMPAAHSIYGSELTSIANASAYVCRPRNGTSKLSEHAFGNAFDMARFVLKDGTAIDVAATGDAKAQKFLGDIRKAACGPFKTVLGPGSDADHATHLHVDLAPRKSGATFCQ